MRPYFVHYNQTTRGYMNSPYACIKLFYDARSAKVYDSSTNWKPISVYIIPSKHYDALTQAARRFTDYMEEATKDGRSISPGVLIDVSRDIRIALELANA